jgi:aryl-alcohol dehydrogenase-like predicted oxidoreductase
MQYKYLGRTGLQVSRLGLGTMNFGMVTDQAIGFEIMDEALNGGINYFDTADVYGGPQKPDIEKGYGVSEEIIGRWLAQGGRREHIVLATKVYQPMDFGPNDRHLSAYHIRKACEDSLRRLQRIVSTSIRCTHRSPDTLGRDLAGNGTAGAARQGALHRQQQLRRI